MERRVVGGKADATREAPADTSATFHRFDSEKARRKKKTSVTFDGCLAFFVARRKTWSLEITRNSPCPCGFHTHTHTHTERRLCFTFFCVDLYLSHNEVLIVNHNKSHSRPWKGGGTSRFPACGSHKQKKKKKEVCHDDNTMSLRNGGLPSPNPIHLSERDHY
jgi:hypothetical protein